MSAVRPRSVNVRATLRTASTCAYGLDRVLMAQFQIVLPTMSASFDYLGKCISPSAREPMSRLDFILFTLLNAAGWTLLNTWLGPYGQARQDMVLSIVPDIWPWALLLEWTYLCATLNRAADLDLDRFLFATVFVPGRLFALAHMIVIPGEIAMIVIFATAILPVVFLMVCPARTWTADAEISDGPRTYLRIEPRGSSEAPGMSDQRQDTPPQFATLEDKRRWASAPLRRRREKADRDDSGGGDCDSDGDGDCGGDD